MSLGVWAIGIEVRLVYLQIVQHADLVARAERQQTSSIPVPAKRGDIVDRKGRVLATSVDADTIVVPPKIADPEAAVVKLCGALADCTDKERQTLTDRFRRGVFTYVRRRIAADQKQRVEALELEGVGFVKESRRFYPKKELAAHLLGYVGVDNTGLDGLEAAYDSRIRGKDGKVLVQTDARRHAFSRIDRPPTTGATIELTIDEYLQHVAERELHAGVVATRAAGGSVIIMNPHTGEILAMANEPTFNPNVYREFAGNRAAQPRGAGSLRTGLDVQGRHRVGGDRREGDAARHADRYQSRDDPDPGTVEADHRSEPPQLRRAVVERCHRPIQQRRRDQDRIARRHGSAEPFRVAVWIRAPGVPRFSG